MDIDRVRTFLEIVQTGSFLRAAERLHVTQTTVSARIRTLEEDLGRKLFVRNRNGARLTAAGAEFERFAQMFVQVWERARQQLAVPPGRNGVVSIGAELSLWNPLLVDWMAGMKERDPRVLVRARVGMPETLVDDLRTGTLDVALVYAPQLIPDFKVELLMEEQLVLVRSVQNASDDYVYVDWGPAFAAQHGTHAPILGDPAIFASFGPLGLSYILRAGGNGYFRLGMVTPLIEAGRLELVEDAPRFTYPAYAVYAEEAAQRPEIASALKILQEILKAK
ncbi:LysR family transcriptional regulator [Chelativorans sp. SCAU2101]|jgi:Transcriptional regulator|uniref:LysR family transcriptional regulator n=1 Tax=Chelativorans petroleitrophicus TaxID=2975484 RepID=A0A9X3B921_9HYPH|nr:LysR family transcriptional regulator [Chelativorans petroleitrophicus]MCT8989736.1 LysR family transcriptional regulator [Chelativorans petroleitrophicus]